MTQRKIVHLLRLYHLYFTMLSFLFLAMENHFEGKSAIITGTSSGIGYALAKEFALGGAKVFAAARSQDKLQALQEDVCSQGGTLTAVPTDVSDPSDVHRLFAAVSEAECSPDIVVNNAAVGHNTEAHTMTAEQMKQVVATNLLGTMYVTREALQGMIERNKGHLVFLSSLAGKMAFPSLSVYSATKFGIEGFTESIREELKGTNILITIARPGVTDTNFFQTAGMEDFAHAMQGKMHSPDQVAGEIVKAIRKKRSEITIGSDRNFLLFLKHLPRSLARRLLPFFS